jgi:K+-sensing histidine kinase KdpD
MPLSMRAVDLIAWEVTDNAIKFHPARNPILQITVQQNPDRGIVLSIADNGTHVAADQIEQVWQPFVQGEKYATGEMPGMGLGLPSIAALIWQVGGTVELTNRTDGPGVRVTMTLPAR